MKIISFLAALFLTFTITTTAMANEYADAIKQLVDEQIREWVNSDAVVSAVNAQNKNSASLDQAAIDALDKKWRAEVKGDNKSFIDSVLENSLSAFLKDKKEESQGLFSEIFVMDMKGLNVGQSDVTSDYWQGDEAKWQKTYGAGPDAILIDDVEFDDSSQSYQSQVSLTVVDPATNAPIGAVTIGVNVEALE